MRRNRSFDDQTGKMSRLRKRQSLCHGCADRLNKCTVLLHKSATILSICTVRLQDYWFKLGTGFWDKSATAGDESTILMGKSVVLKNRSAILGQRCVRKKRA